MKKSIKTRTAYLSGVCISIFIVFSIIVSYIFYSSAVNMVGDDSTQTLTSAFFIIFSCAEVIVGIILVVLITLMAEAYIVKPLKKMNVLINDMLNSKLPLEERLSSDDFNSKLKELNINSGDELEETYLSIKKMQNQFNDYVVSMKGQSWDSEHDAMTMLSNRTRFEKRKEEVYPYVESIYIACLDVINLSLVNTKLSTEAGDSIITKVGRELRRVSADDIHTYRLEEDNFLIVLCGRSEKEAVEWMNIWNSRVGRLNRSSDNFECQIVWGGAYGEKDFNVDEIFKRADAEMYCQKMIVKKELVTL